MTDRAALEKEIRTVLESQGVAVLSTRGEDYPHACLVAYAVTGDLSTLVFVTSRSTRKYANIRQWDRISLLADTRSNREEDFHDARAVSVHGRAVSLDPSQDAGLRDLFLHRHPYLDSFVRSPSCVLIRVDVASYSLVSRFQNVLILDMRGGDPGRS